MAWTTGVVNEWPYYDFTVAQGRHRATSTIRYAISTSMSTSSTSTANLINKAMPIAISKWNDSSEGVTFCKDGDSACDGYDTSNGIVAVELGDCGPTGIACLVPGPGFPHNTNGPVKIEETPCWDVFGEEVCSLWTNTPPMDGRGIDYWYLPAVIAHELGHSAGLGHSSRRHDKDVSTGDKDLMRHGANLTGEPTSYEEAAMRAVLDISHPHPHESR